MWLNTVKSKEDLDAEMDKYMLRDEKTGTAILDNDLDDYFKNKSSKDELDKDEKIVDTPKEADAE